MLRGSRFVVIERPFQLAASCTPLLFAQVCPHPFIFCSNEELTAKIQHKAGGSHGYESRPD